MLINTFWSWEIPDKLEGVVVIADVYAATTNIVSFLARGVSRLLIVDRENVVSIRKRLKEAVVIGESPDLPDLTPLSS